MSLKELVILVKETTMVAFKKRDGNFRKKIILTLSVVAIIYGPNHGEIFFYIFNAVYCGAYSSLRWFYFNSEFNQETVTVNWFSI